jgi:hypothetical protein
MIMCSVFITEKIKNTAFDESTSTTLVDEKSLINHGELNNKTIKEVFK